MLETELSTYNCPLRKAMSKALPEAAAASRDERVEELAADDRSA